MKKAYLALFTSFIAAASYGQSLQNVIFNTTGGDIGSTGSIHMVLSVGEPVIGTPGSSDVDLAQGFLGGSKYVASALSVEDIAVENALVYPNPFSNYVKISSTEQNIHVSVYDMMGQEVYEGSYVNGGIDLSHLTQGMYVIHASANGKTISNTKILKQ